VCSFSPSYTLHLVLFSISKVFVFVCAFVSVICCRVLLLVGCCFSSRSVCEPSFVDDEAVLPFYVCYYVYILCLLFSEHLHIEDLVL